VIFAIVKIADKKFLKTLEEVFKSAKTEPRVKAMIYKAVALLAYESRVSKVFTSVAKGLPNP